MALADIWYGRRYDYLECEKGQANLSKLPRKIVEVKIAKQDKSFYKFKQIWSKSIEI